MFAIVSFIRLADPEFERFNRWALVGMVVMGCIPTTVSTRLQCVCETERLMI